MRTGVAMVGVLLVAAVGYADEADLLNAATINALDEAQASLEQAPKVDAAIKRIGVATVEGDVSNVTDLVKSMLTKTEFDVVLTSDADWGPLLDEFARQVKRKDIILKETAHKLRVQGVDAVLFGAVEKSGVEQVKDKAGRGQRATVRVMLSLASLAEENPGSLLWSEQFSGTAEDITPFTLEEKVLVFAKESRLLLGVLVALLVAFIFVTIVRRLMRPY